MGVGDVWRWEVCGGGWCVKVGSVWCVEVDGVWRCVIGASLSEPHTSGTALRKCVCNILVCLRPYTVNFKCAFKYFPKIERPRALIR